MARIKVTPSGGVAPYTISFTMNRSLNCNIINSSGNEMWSGNGGITINNICSASGYGLTPVSTITGVSLGDFYSVNVSLLQDAVIVATITDANGCIFVCTKPINAEDVRCFAGNSGIAKVTLCHQTGNYNNPCATICVNESAVETHLAHGDFMGTCTPNCLATVYTARIRQSQIMEEWNKQKFDVRVIPNPSKNQFALLMKGSRNERVSIVVYDIPGRNINQLEKSNNGLPIEFGNELKTGIYIVVVRQGNNIKTIKLVKQ